MAWSTPPASSSKKVFGISSRCLFTSKTEDDVRTVDESNRLTISTPDFYPILPKPPSHGLLHKAPSKYRPPEFIPTVIRMRELLYEDETDMTEPTTDAIKLAIWKGKLKKEHWFSHENVSTVHATELI